MGVLDVELLLDTLVTPSEFYSHRHLTGIFTYMTQERDRPEVLGYLSELT